jgi:glycosyltransferase involved in cell wall biosynthesis
VRISVITICLNAEAFIAKTLESVLAQEYEDIEHIVVDGGSTDATISIISAASESNPKLYWASGPDAGLSDAMNKGVERSTGDIIAFLHADDFYFDSKVLATVAARFEADTQAGWLTGGMCHVNGDGKMLKYFPPRRCTYQKLLRGNILFHPSTFVKRQSFINAGGFDQSLSYAMDYDLWLRLGKLSQPIVIEQPLANFRVHAGSLSVHNVNSAFLEEYKVRNRYLEGKALLKIIHSLFYLLKIIPSRMSVRY